MIFEWFFLAWGVWRQGQGLVRFLPGFLSSIPREHYVCVFFLLSVKSAKSFTAHQEEVSHPFYYKGEEKCRERN